MRFLILAVAVAGLGCSGALEPEIGDEFELRVGRSVIFEDAGLWVAFLGVAEDSRCPTRVQCVWAGDALVLVETAPYPDAGNSKTDTLHTHQDPKVLSLGAVELELVGLDPYPEEPGSIEAADYVARFRTVAR